VGAEPLSPFDRAAASASGGGGGGLVDEGSQGRGVEVKDLVWEVRGAGRLWVRVSWDLAWKEREQRLAARGSERNVVFMLR
jgi:hypothetical protein